VFDIIESMVEGAARHRESGLVVLDEMLDNYSVLVGEADCGA